MHTQRPGRLASSSSSHGARPPTSAKCRQAPERAVVVAICSLQRSARSPPPRTVHASVEMANLNRPPMSHRESGGTPGRYAFRRVRYIVVRCRRHARQLPSSFFAPAARDTPICSFQVVFFFPPLSLSSYRLRPRRTAGISRPLCAPATFVHACRLPPLEERGMAMLSGSCS